MYNISVINKSKQPLSYMYLYDEFVEASVQDKYTFQVWYNSPIEQKDTTKRQFNITMDSDIIDLDGYPKYVQIICDDKDGNSWVICFYKVKDLGKIYYIPRDYEML